MNQDVDENRKLFWKGVRKMRKKGGELQYNKGWKWEAGTERGRIINDLEGLFCGSI